MGVGHYLRYYKQWGKLAAYNRDQAARGRCFITISVSMTCVQLSTYSSEISKLGVSAPKPFHVVRILCGMAAFRKKAWCLQNTVTYHVQGAASRRRLRNENLQLRDFRQVCLGLYMKKRH